MFTQLGGGLTDVAQQQLFAYAGNDPVLTALPKVTFPDTGAAAGGALGLRWWWPLAAVLAGAGVLAGLAGVAAQSAPGASMREHRRARSRAARRDD